MTSLDVSTVVGMMVSASMEAAVVEVMGAGSVGFGVLE